MGKASRRKKERRSGFTSTEVSSRESFREDVDPTPEKSISVTRSNEHPAPSISGDALQRSANWGGRRANQTGRPKLYDSDEERREAATTRRQAARAAPKEPPPKPRGRVPKEEVKNSWGGARSGAGRTLIYKTREQRLARNSELSQQSSARWKARQEAASLVERIPQDWQRFTVRTTSAIPPPNPIENP